MRVIVVVATGMEDLLEHLRTRLIPAVKAVEEDSPKGHAGQARWDRRRRRLLEGEDESSADQVF